MKHIFQKLQEITNETDRTKRDILIRELEVEVQKLHLIEKFSTEDIQFLNRHFLPGRIN